VNRGNAFGMRASQDSGRFARALVIALAIAASTPSPIRAADSTAAAPDSAARAAAGDADSLSIPQCVALAIRHAPELAAAHGDSAAAVWDTVATSLNRRPVYSIAGGALLAPSGFYDPVLTNLGEYALRARAEWPLLDGGARERERGRSRLALARASNDVVRTRRDVGLQAALDCVELLRLSEREAIQRASIAWLERLAGEMREGVRAGAHGRGDAVRLSLERDAIDADLISTRETIETTSRHLRRLLGGEGTAPHVRDPGPDRDRPPAAEDSIALIEAVHREPDVQDARLEEAERQIAIEEDRKRNALHVDLSADAGLWGSDLTTAIPPDVRASNPNATFSDRLRRDLGASVALEFRRQVLDATRTSTARARGANLGASHDRVNLSLAERERLIRDLLTHWRSAAERLNAAAEAEKRADEHMLRMESLYAGGGATLLEVLDARQVMDDAAARASEARAQLREARYEAEAQQ
jgi:outer membrane protein TolC